MVPDGVPYAEKSLANQVTVQLVHLLQDIYPLVSSHQEAGGPNPQERFDRAYTFPYRCVRGPPRWHPDLVAASASKDLLGALASGGPFAKLLARIDPHANEYVIDLAHFANYGVRAGLCQLGSRIRFAAPEGQLVVTGMSCRPIPTSASGSTRWTSTSCAGCGHTCRS